VNIGAHLRQLREERGYSQSALAERTGFSTHYISKVEHGHHKPLLRNLEKWAASLEVPLWQLFFYADGVPGEQGDVEGRALTLIGKLLEGTVPECRCGRRLAELRARIESETECLI
jgi:transcriptional regulator with XRE-family HTH domain